MEIKKILPPSGKRKHKIILEAVFNPSYKEGEDLDKILSMHLGKMGMFD